MTAVKIEPPKDAGAARVSVFGPDGKMLMAPQLVVPPSGTVAFEAPKPGTYTAKLESVGTLGTGSALWTFAVEGKESMTVQPPSFATIKRTSFRRARSLASNTPQAPENAITSIDVEQHVEAQPATISTGLAIPSAGMIRYMQAGAGPASASAYVHEQMADAAYSLGVSYDSRPLNYGGWRPYRGAVQVRHSPTGDIEIEFPRDDEPLPAADQGARLRLSLAIEATRVQRILVPRLAGGVAVRVKTSAGSHLSGDTLSITPLRPETHALLQALTSNSTQTATGIWQAISANLNGLADDAAPHADADPWILVASGLLLLRLNELPEHDAWIGKIADTYPWIADASILAAHRSLAQSPPDVASALKHLNQARRIGAVYFFEANRLQGDLLVALASDAPDPKHRSVAANELAQWRHNLANQVQVGGFFSWLMTNGARNRGGLDARYSAILDSGRMAVGTL